MLGLDYISIHLMLLFNNRNSSFAVVFIAISIHLMLLFNCLACYFFAVNVCDFNTSNVTIQPKFQHHRKGLYLNFNTSNVTIQLSLSSPTMSFLYISIHLMLLFNFSRTGLKATERVISIHLMLLFNLLCRKKYVNPLYFNTSNVTIQRCKK